MSLPFQFSSSICGFKKTKKPDLAIIYSPTPCTYAGVFTTNQIHAACVDENRRLLKGRKKIRAVITNSGNANACTGKKGILAVKKTQQIAAKLLTQRAERSELRAEKKIAPRAPYLSALASQLSPQEIKPDEILVASTGVIGVHLDMEKIKKGLEAAIPQLNANNLKRAARAILTTDRFEKIVRKKTKDFSLIGFTKGAGMIHPNMATMLCFLMTDLKMPQKLLQGALKIAVENSFNAISVDGDMSTNDMVILLSNNQSKKEIKSHNESLYINFQKVLSEACSKLAKEIVIDGEGANKLITVRVLGARSTSDARKIARSVASSTLFKCAVFGSDPNWGRAAARIGWVGIRVDQNKIDIFLNNTQVFKNGNLLEFDKKRLNKEIKRRKEVQVTINLKLGNKSASAFGCDLSYEYVKFNSAYFT